MITSLDSLATILLLILAIQHHFQNYQIEVLITKDIKSGDSEPYLDITLPSGEVIKSKVLTGKSLSNYSTLTFNVSLSESPMSIVLSDKLGNQEYGKATIDSRSQGGNAVDNSGSDAGSVSYTHLTLPTTPYV